MTDPARRFTDVMIRPFGEEIEARAAAEQKVATALPSPADDGRLEKAAAQLEKPRPSWRRWMIASLWVAAVFFYIWLTGWGRQGLALDLSTLSYQLAQLTGKGAPTGRTIGGLAASLPAEQKMILFGDPAGGPGALRWKALSDHHPGDPVHFSTYTVEWVSEKKALPPDFARSAKAIDPENAWFPALEAAILAEGSSKRLKKATETEGPVWQISDPAKMEQALELIRQCSRLPRFDSYETVRFASYATLLPKPQSYADQTLITGYLVAKPTMEARFRVFVNVFSSKASELTKSRDAAGFRELLSTWKGFMALYLPSSDATLVGHLVKRMVLDNTAKDLSRAAASLGLETEAKQLAAIGAGIDDFRSQADPGMKRQRDEITTQSGTLAGLMLPPLSSLAMVAPPSPVELAPSRLAEHELAWSLFSTSVSGLFVVITLGAACYAFRTGSLNRKLSIQYLRLMSPGDRLWIAGLGVLIPFLLIQWAVRSTPYAGWDRGLMHTRALLPGLAMVILIWSLVVLPLAIARWRMSRSLRFAGFTRASVRKVKTLLPLLLFIALLGMLGGLTTSLVNADHLRIGGKGAGKEDLMLAAATGGFFCLWLLVLACRALFSSPELLLARSILARLLAPAWALAALLLVCSAIHSRDREHDWVRRDTILNPSPAAPGASGYEYRAVQVLHDHLLQIWTHSPNANVSH